MSHAEYASKSLAVSRELAAMLRIVRAVQFIFDKLAALLRGKASDEMRASEFLGEASRITRSAVDQHATQSSCDHAIAVSETNDQPNREKLIRRRWLETGIKMWNPDHHGAGHALGTTATCSGYAADWLLACFKSAGYSRRGAQQISLLILK
jgi:hypothetical protein